MSEMVNGKRNLISDDLTYLAHIVFQEIQPFFGQMNARKGMSGRDDLIAFLMFYHVCRDRTALNIQNVRRILFHILDESERCVERAGLV